MTCGAVPFHIGMSCAAHAAVVAASRCRWCGKSEPCGNDECVQHDRVACRRKLPCGHRCRGVANDTCKRGAHPPCLEKGCAGGLPGTEGDDPCGICYIDTLSQAPVVRGACGHVFHSECVKARLEAKWPTRRITFKFLTCPHGCHQDLLPEVHVATSAPLVALRKDVDQRIATRAVHEGLKDHAAVKDPKSPFYHNVMAYGRETLCYYQCSNCGKPYFGGLRSCEAAGMEDEDPAGGGDAAPGDSGRDALLCPRCTPTSESAKLCTVHPPDFVEYKCRFCCNVASYFCWGTTHFCKACHAVQVGGLYLNRIPVVRTACVCILSARLWWPPYVFDG